MSNDSASLVSSPEASVRLHQLASSSEVKLELFRETSLEIFWPLCIVLWTIMGAVSLFESWQKHRHTLKDVASITNRLSKLERQSRSSTKQIAGKVKDTHVVKDETGQAKLRIYFESGAVYEIDYGSDN